jgi:hypothetical protein
VTPLARPSRSRLFEEFFCRECGSQEAYRSRPRNFLEKYVLPFLMLQAVRCERCYHRVYILSTIPVLDRSPLERKQPQNESGGGSKPNSGVA